MTREERQPEEMGFTETDSYEVAEGRAFYRVYRESLPCFELELVRPHMGS